MGSGTPSGPQDPPREAGTPDALAVAAQVFVSDLEHPVLTDADAHHLARVLRLRAGEAVVAADGRGGWRLCRYGGGDGPAAVRLQVEGEAHQVPPPESEVTVGFVPVKGERPEWVVQKLTELGVDHIVVLRSERAVVRWEGDRAARSLDRLRRVAKEAAAQSRRPRLPAVDGVWDLPAIEAACRPDALALADPRGRHPETGLRCLAVGPEGGWGPNERGGDRPLVQLGSAVLRAETAAMAAATLLCGFRDGLVTGP